MHTVVIKGKEMFDSKTNRFFYEKDVVFNIEHSLYAIKKWESKWHTYFIGNDKKTEEQMLDYIKCMILTDDISDNVLKRLTKQNYEDITAYMNDPMTATWFGQKDKEEKNGGNPITNEIVYYWMVELNIPQEYQYWHINQLMTLIKVISTKRDEAEKKAKNKKKRPDASAIERRRKINEERKRRFNTHG